MNSLVSVVIPAYNAEKYIKGTIEGIMNQSYANWEIIVCDDGSTVPLKPYIRDYLKDARIKYFKKQNSGVSDTRNFGFTKASGQYLCFLDADDKLERDFLRDSVDILEKFKDVGFTGTQSQKIDEKDQLVDAKVYNPVCKNIEKEILIYEKPYCDFLTCPSAYIFRRNVLEQVSFSTLLSSPADRYFLLQVNKITKGTLLRPGKNKMLYRIVNNSMSHNQNLKYFRDNSKYYYMLKKIRLSFSPENYKAFVFGHCKILAYGYFKNKKILKGTKFLLKSFWANPKYYFRKYLLL